MSKAMEYQPAGYNHDATEAKRRKQADRFRYFVEAMVRTQRNFVTIGPDPVVYGLAEECGIDVHDYCQFEIRLKAKTICLVFVPERHWHLPASMERFGELKAAAAAVGRHVALVPEALVRRVARSGRLDDHAIELDLDIGANDRMAVISFLASTGGGKLSEVAGLLDHPNPVAAVLRLATIGAVHIDLDANILPATRVSFPRAVH